MAFTSTSRIDLCSHIISGGQLTESDDENSLYQTLLACASYLLQKQFVLPSIHHLQALQPSCLYLLSKLALPGVCLCPFIFALFK